MSFVRHQRLKEIQVSRGTLLETEGAGLWSGGIVLEMTGGVVTTTGGEVSAGSGGRGFGGGTSGKAVEGGFGGQFVT
jgi:hypothetical protein